MRVEASPYLRTASRLSPAFNGPLTPPRRLAPSSVYEEQSKTLQGSARVGRREIQSRGNPTTLPHSSGLHLSLFQRRNTVSSSSLTLSGSGSSESLRERPITLRICCRYSLHPPHLTRWSSNRVRSSSESA